MPTSNETTENDIFDSVNLENETEFKTLVRSIKLSEGFSLFFARANEISTQTELIINLENEFPEKEIKIIVFSNPTIHLFNDLRKILSNQKPFLILICGLNESFPTDANSPKNGFIKNLNASRNSFPKIIDCPIVLFVPDFAITAIMRGANDFFSFRSNVFYFESNTDTKAAQIGQVISANYSEIGSLTIQERKERIKTIQDLLKDESDKERQIRLHVNLGQIYNFSAEYKKAESEFNLVLKLSDKLNNLEMKGEIYNNLGMLYIEQGKYYEAIRFFKQALLIDEKVVGKDHPDYATRLNNLAIVYNSQGKYDKAIELYKEALLIGEKTIGKNHPNYAARLNNLAIVYNSQGKYDEAIELFKQALLIDEKTIGKDHPDYAIHLNNLAIVYDSQGKYDKAIELYKEALLIGEKTIGKNHPNYARRLNNLAGVYEAIRQYQEALELYEEALIIDEKTLPKNHPHTIRVRRNLEGCRAMLGK